MNQSNIIQLVEECFNKICLVYPDIFLISVQHNPRQGKVIVSLDSDQPLTIDYLTQIHRNMNETLEKQNVFSKHNFALELTSPGADQPLVNKRQYFKNIGREVSVQTDEQHVKQGVLKHVEANAIVLERKTKVKKLEILEEEKIFFNHIKQTQVNLKF